MKNNFKNVLDKVITYVKNLGFNVVINDDIDEFFKGDLDGLNIYLKHISHEEDLFNILHMVGHSIQWNLSDDLRKLGNVIYKNPDNDVLNKLQEYEWEANCYGYTILVNLGYSDLKNWLEKKYILDMFYLTHFYRTGEKLRVINDDDLKQSFSKPLNNIHIPKIIPVPQTLTRNGIVIDF